jgi:Leucine-rich repeat (LRR) protein
VPRLAHLDLSHNQLEAFDLNFLSSSSSSAGGGADEDDSGTGLHTLDISNNAIRRLDLHRGRHSLVRLDCARNQLEVLEPALFSGFHQLAVLDLSRNDIIES